MDKNSLVYCEISLYTLLVLYSLNFFAGSSNYCKTVVLQGQCRRKFGKDRGSIGTSVVPSKVGLQDIYCTTEKDVFITKSGKGKERKNGMLAENPLSASFEKIC